MVDQTGILLLVHLGCQSACTCCPWDRSDLAPAEKLAQQNRTVWPRAIGVECFAFSFAVSNQLFAPSSSRSRLCDVIGHTPMDQFFITIREKQNANATWRIFKTFLCSLWIWEQFPLNKVRHMLSTATFMNCQEGNIFNISLLMLPMAFDQPEESITSNVTFTSYCSPRRNHNNVVLYTNYNFCLWRTKIIVTLTFRDLRALFP